MSLPTHLDVQVAEYERGGLGDQEIVDLMGDLLQAGVLPEKYEGTARVLIDGGYLSPRGDRQRDVEDGESPW